MYLNKIVVATRPSKLSLVQTEIAIRWIKRTFPDLEFEIRTFKSTGDKVLDRPLYMIGIKGVFEKEINQAVLRGDADIAVHSLKDLPASIDPRLELACYPPRDSPYDVIVVRKGERPSIYELKSGAVIGTSSIRRRVFIRRLRPDLKLEDIRGNVDTRIRKLLSGQYDAIVLAECGIERLRGSVPEIDEVDYDRLSLDELPPAPGQGIIVIVCRKDDTDLLKMLREASHRETTAEATCERAFLKTFGGGCHTPLGCLATCIRDNIRFHAYLADKDTNRVYKVELCGSITNAEHLGIRGAEELKKIIREIKNS
ncbi:MAG: hydroxymethylbilane synthase [Crenarchaeota archaeon]|nr:hydroxymethylbilane synthase [Thermoproteota archaeon]